MEARPPSRAQITGIQARGTQAPSLPGPGPLPPAQAACVLHMLPCSRSGHSEHSRHFPACRLVFLQPHPRESKFL